MAPVKFQRVRALSNGPYCDPYEQEDVYFWRHWLGLLLQRHARVRYRYVHLKNNNRRIVLGLFALYFQLKISYYTSFLLFWPTKKRSKLFLTSLLNFFTCAAKKIWNKISFTGDLPHDRRGHSASLIDRRIVFFGGEKERNLFNDVYIYDTGMYF